MLLLFFMILQISKNDIILHHNQSISYLFPQTVWPRYGVLTVVEKHLV